MEPMRMSPMQPRQRQKLLSRPSDKADGGKPSRHRSTGESTTAAAQDALSPPDSQCRKTTSTEVHHCTNTDRTARTKATSSVAIQTDSFQDNLGEIGELVQTDSFHNHLGGILEIGAH